MKQSRAAVHDEIVPFKALVTCKGTKTYLGAVSRCSVFNCKLSCVRTILSMEQSQHGDSTCDMQGVVLLSVALANVPITGSYPPPVADTRYSPKMAAYAKTRPISVAIVRGTSSIAGSCTAVSIDFCILQTWHKSFRAHGKNWAFIELGIKDSGLIRYTENLGAYRFTEPRVTTC